MPDKPYRFSKESLKRNSDFGTANQAAALIQKVLLPYAENAWDKTFVKRLRQMTIKIVNTGNPELKGKLQFTDGDVSLLRKLDFNGQRELRELVHFFPRVNLENANFLTISIPKIELENSFRHPKSATSIIVRCICSIIHFDLGKGGTTQIDDLEIFVGKPFEGATVKVPLQAAETSVVMVTMCVWCLNGGIRIKRPPKWYAGEVFAIYNLLDGKERPFEYTDETIKIHRPPEIEPNKRKGDLSWDLK